MVSKDKIESDLKEALKRRESERVSVLRLLLSALHNQEIDKGGTLDEQEIIPVVEGEIKKRREAIEGYRSGGREESAISEEHELKILESYLPPQLTDEELEDIVKRVIGENPGLPAGPLMGKVKEQVKGKAESRRVIETIKKLL